MRGFFRCKARAALKGCATLNRRPLLAQAFRPAHGVTPLGSMERDAFRQAIERPLCLMEREGVSRAIGAIVVAALYVSSAAAAADPRLISAVKNRDLDSVRELLKQRVDVNA